MGKDKFKSGHYGRRTSKKFVPPENIPDLVDVPEKTIYVLTNGRMYNASAKKLIEPLAGKKERDWFSQHSYFCLPLTFGNQHGFIVKSQYDVIARWNGGDYAEDLEVFLPEAPDPSQSRQQIESHFGQGIITVQNHWTFRTPRGVNLMVVPPPNFLIDGINHLSAVVETDQLRRDFTFNLKVTRKQFDVFIPKGTPIGCILPYPRFFVDKYDMLLHPEGEVLENERKTIQYFRESRDKYEEGLPNLWYMKGVDIYGNKFEEHQKTIPAGAFFTKQRKRKKDKSTRDAPSQAELTAQERALEFIREAEQDHPAALHLGRKLNNWFRSLIGLGPKGVKLIPAEGTTLEKGTREIYIAVDDEHRKLCPGLTQRRLDEVVEYISEMHAQERADSEVEAALHEIGWSKKYVRFLLEVYRSELTGKK